MGEDFRSRTLKKQKHTMICSDQTQHMNSSRTLEATESSQAGGPSVELDYDGEGKTLICLNLSCV